MSVYHTCPLVDLKFPPGTVLVSQIHVGSGSFAERFGILFAGLFLIHP